MRNGLHPRAAIAVRHAIARHLDIDASLVSPTHELQDDLGLDSFDLTFIVLRLEDQFDVEVSLPPLDDHATVAELASTMANLVTAEERDDLPRSPQQTLHVAVTRRSSGFRARADLVDEPLAIRRVSR